MNPAVDGVYIRLNLPQLTEERRKDLIKLLGQKAEETKIAVRKTREEALREVDEQEKKKEISEDEKFRKKSEAQKTVDEINKKIEEIVNGKEKEIMNG